MAVTEETKTVLRAAKAIRRVGDETMARAYTLTASGAMTHDELKDLKETYYLPLLRVAGDLVLKQARIESEAIAPHVDALKKATKRLEQALKDVESTGKVVAIAVTALSIITSLIGVVLSPDSESLGDVAKRIGGLAETIGEIASGDDDE
jgi:hypothetical protein